jgi:hypothetical protein
MAGGKETNRLYPCGLLLYQLSYDARARLNIDGTRTRDHEVSLSCTTAQLRAGGGSGGKGT